MTIALGIDTGGTYTDAVLVDHDSGQVLAGAKALTTRRDLSLGIGQAVMTVFSENGQAITPTDVDLVSLSTTLATNAIVEAQGSPVCLLLIGYDAELLRQYGFEHDLVTEDVVFLRGGHNVMGNEVAPLDEAAAQTAILERCDHVEAFAVSGFFSVRNPTHELRVRALVEALTRQANGEPKPVTCGHELTTRLNAVRRATTVALNARLIPLLQELTITVQRTLEELGIIAPLMVVKGDGSLVRAQWAMQRPIETILSGPAASVVGAWHLAGRNRRRYGGYIIHLGVVLMAIGIIGIEVFQTETQGTISQGEQITLGDYTVSFNSLSVFDTADGRNVARAVMAVSKDGQYVGELYPRGEYYYESQQPMTIPGVRSTWEDDFYILLIDWQPISTAGATFKIYHNPLVGMSKPHSALWMCS